MSSNSSAYGSRLCRRPLVRVPTCRGRIAARRLRRRRAPCRPRRGLARACRVLAAAHARPRRSPRACKRWSRSWMSCCKKPKRPPRQRKACPSWRARSSLLPRSRAMATRRVGRRRGLRRPRALLRAQLGRLLVRLANAFDGAQQVDTAAPLARPRGASRGRIAAKRCSSSKRSTATASGEEDPWRRRRRGRCGRCLACRVLYWCGCWGPPRCPLPPLHSRPLCGSYAPNSPDAPSVWKAAAVKGLNHTRGARGGGGRPPPRVRCSTSRVGSNAAAVAAEAEAARLAMRCSRRRQPSSSTPSCQRFARVGHDASSAGRSPPSAAPSLSRGAS